MPDVKKTSGKTIDATLDQVTYPSDIDNMVRDDRPFEGTENSLPPSGTNPMFGADGTLPSKIVTKVNRGGSITDSE